MNRPYSACSNGEYADVQRVAFGNQQLLAVAVEGVEYPLHAYESYPRSERGVMVMHVGGVSLRQETHRDLVLPRRSCSNSRRLFRWNPTWVSSREPAPTGSMSDTGRGCQ